VAALAIKTGSLEKLGVGKIRLDYNKPAIQPPIQALATALSIRHHHTQSLRYSSLSGGEVIDFELTLHTRMRVHFSQAWTGVSQNIVPPERFSKLILQYARLRSVTNACRIAIVSRLDAVNALEYSRAYDYGKLHTTKTDVKNPMMWMLGELRQKGNSSLA
jgi:hypothetical protein